jgi:membrane protein YqaA with SNARE-associated domain
MLLKLYNTTLSLASHRHAVPILALIAFIESSVFPIPPDVLLIPIILSRPRDAFKIALICTLASVAGGAFGYAIGALLFEGFGQPVLAFYGMESQFDTFSDAYNNYGAWAVLFAGVTPFPYKVITILSGTTGLNFTVFMVASIIARALRFFIIAALLWKFGAPVKAFIERRLGLVFTVALVALIAGFAAVKLL